MNFIEHLLEHARRELKITNFDQTEFGNVVLNFLEQGSIITNNNQETMKNLSEILKLLIDKLPISPIHEGDFVEEIYHEGDRSITMYRCTRYQHLYRTEDGRYWDDRAVAYKFRDSKDADIMYLYQTNFNSKREVFLPYYPSREVIVIDREDIN